MLIGDLIKSLERFRDKYGEKPIYHTQDEEWLEITLPLCEFEEFRKIEDDSDADK